MQPVFTNTSPCADIARHFKVSQALVDHAMEWKLYETGIRKKSPDSKHADRLLALSQETDLDTRIAIDKQLELVAAAILVDAEKRRLAEEAAAS